jgi:hypothetical protein
VINCVSAEHARPIVAEFLWRDADCRPRFYCGGCVGWHLLGALYDEGTMPLGVDLLSGMESDHATTPGWDDSAAWTSEPWWGEEDAA